MRHIVPTVLVGAIVAIGIAISFRLAVAGEPQSAWLWGDVLGVIR